ncbi:MAG: hypothetical protein LBB38_00870, partial [Puniceicoccales bacterium]|nr:hypothetical protein [Puniceicoccales bacterium]
ESTKESSSSSELDATAQNIDGKPETPPAEATPPNVIVNAERPAAQTPDSDDEQRLSGSEPSKTPPATAVIVEAPSESLAVDATHVDESPAPPVEDTPPPAKVGPEQPPAAVEATAESISPESLAETPLPVEEAAPPAKEAPPAKVNLRRKLIGWKSHATQAKVFIKELDANGIEKCKMHDQGPWKEVVVVKGDARCPIPKPQAQLDIADYSTGPIAQFLISAYRKKHGIIKIRISNSDIDLQDAMPAIQSAIESANRSGKFTTDRQRRPSNLLIVIERSESEPKPKPKPEPSKSFWSHLRS